jgi:hypothetical protein
MYANFDTSNPEELTLVVRDQGNALRQPERVNIAAARHDAQRETQFAQNALPENREQEQPGRDQIYDQNQYPRVYALAYLSMTAAAGLMLWKLVELVIHSEDNNN